MKVVGAGEPGVPADGLGDINPDIADSRAAWGCALKKCSLPGSWRAVTASFYKLPLDLHNMYFLFSIFWAPSLWKEEDASDSVASMLWVCWDGYWEVSKFFPFSSNEDQNFRSLKHSLKPSKYLEISLVPFFSLSLQPFISYVMQKHSFPINVVRCNVQLQFSRRKLWAN